MKKRLISALAIMMCLVMLFTVGCASNEAIANQPANDNAANAGNAPAAGNLAVPGNDDTVYIGIVKYFTGDNMQVGEYAKESADLAAEEINAAGGILGKNVEIVYIEEGDGSVDATVNAMSYALEDERLSAMVFGHSSQNCIAAAELLHKAEKPIPTLWGGSGVAVPLATDAKNEYSWQTRPIDASGADMVVKMAVEENNIQNPCIFYAETTPAIANAEKHRAFFEDLGIKVDDTMYIGHAATETNFASFASTIKANNPDFIMLCGQESDLALKVIALNEVGIDTNEVFCMGVSAITSKIVLDTAGEASEGWYAQTDWCTTVDSETSKNFYNSFVEKYGYEPTNTNAVVYDQVYLMKHAMEKANSTTDRAAIRDALNNMKDQEMVTGMFTSNNETHTYLNANFWARIDENQVVQFERIINF